MYQSGQRQVARLAPAPAQVSRQALRIGCHPARMLIGNNIAFLDTFGK
jgi:hypothetical protein